jgi:hypothetical protein
MSLVCIVSNIRFARSLSAKLAIHIDHKKDVNQRELKNAHNLVHQSKLINSL